MCWLLLVGCWLFDCRLLKFVGRCCCLFIVVSWLLFVVDCMLFVASSLLLGVFYVLSGVECCL